jgi:hypothetical protein
MLLEFNAYPIIKEVVSSFNFDAVDNGELIYSHCITAPS